MFETAYKARLTDKIHFGDNWCGPDQFGHGDHVVIATYAADGDDGRDVEVVCCAMPARFYEIRVKPSKVESGYTITTGSGMDRWAAETALAISTGMAGFIKG